MKSAAFAMSLLLAGAVAQAQPAGFSRPAGPVQPPSERLKKEVGFDPKLGDMLPQDVMLTNHDGTLVPVRSFFSAKKPLLLVFHYQTCPMLCGMQIQSVVASLKGTKYVVGRDFNVLAVSIDPKDTVEGSSEARRKIVSSYGQAGSEPGFIFATGTADAIAKLTAGAGYRYFWDDETKQWAHPQGVLLMTPEGRMARFLPGLEPFPRDLQFAILEASEGEIGTIIDRAVLYCYQYNEASGTYGAAIMKTLRLSAVFTVAALAGFIAFSIRRERKAAAHLTA